LKSQKLQEQKKPEIAFAVTALSEAFREIWEKRNHATNASSIEIDGR
jgi:hypothetical protein